MKICIDLNTPVTVTDIKMRTDVYIWKNLNHLKEFYSGIVDPRDIDKIAGDLLGGTQLKNNWVFRPRSDIGEVLNESCLCNVVEIMLLDQADVLDKFLEKPISFS